MPTFVPFALDTFIATFFDCLSRAIAGPHVPQYGSDLILYIVFIELLTLPLIRHDMNLQIQSALLDPQEDTHGKGDMGSKLHFVVLESSYILDTGKMSST